MAKPRAFLATNTYFVEDDQVDVGHQVDDHVDGFRHRLMVKNKATGEVRIGHIFGYDHVAECGDIRAVTEYWSGKFPRVFRAVELIE